MPTVNLATRYAGQVDERFSTASQAALAVSGNFHFTGAQTVRVYSIPTVAMSDYQRSGTARYGSPADLGNSVTDYTVTQDRAFAFVIDRADRSQTELTQDAGQALARQIREVVIPEYDTYVFRKLASGTPSGNRSNTAATKDNAYSLFLNAQEALGNANVPDTGRVCFCSYAFANLLKQDAAFMRYGDISQSMLTRGVLGETDGVRIVKVPASRLPEGCSFILTHPSAAAAPRQLESYRIHDDPPGISGWLVEGRILYDCFVFAEKSCAIWYQGDALAS